MTITVPWAGWLQRVLAIRSPSREVLKACDCFACGLRDGLSWPWPCASERDACEPRPNRRRATRAGDWRCKP